MKKVQNNDAIENDHLAHYELLINSTKYLSNVCWNLTVDSDSMTRWYGAPAALKQNWPIDPETIISEIPYITTGFGTLSPKKTGSVVEYLWFSSTGYLVFVERDVPLFIELKDKMLCLSAKNTGYPYNQIIKKSSPRPPFKAHIIISENVKMAYLYYLNNFVKRPERTPDPSIYSTTIWSTWAKFKTNITQKKLMEFAKNITTSGLTKYGAIFVSFIRSIFFHTDI